MDIRTDKVKAVFEKFDIAKKNWRGAGRRAAR
jgi:hypothetical protein